MNKLIKYICYCFIAIGMVGCYEEENPIDGLVDIVGDVAQVSQLISPDNVPAGSTIKLVIKSNVVGTEITQFNFYQRIGTSGSYTATTTSPFDNRFVSEERVFVDTVEYVVPNEAGKTFSLQVEALTANGLTSARRTSSPTNIKIK
ncbi:MAG: hypothetical protein R2774_01100 [Saprospiraceae bacterium]